MRRFLLALAALLFVVAGTAAPATAADSCVSAAAAAYRHTFNGGTGTATVTAVHPLCSGQSQTFSLLSYTAPSSTFAYPQFIYDEAQATITAQHSSRKLAVTVPGCYFQVDLIFGGSVFTEVTNAGSNYGNLKLGSKYGTGSRSTGPYGGDADGTSPCSPKPMITYGNACNGTFTASLGNDPSANVDAVFLIAGHRLHVTPGHVAAVERHSGTLTIRDNTFTTHISTWEKPATGCDSSAPSTAATTATANRAVPLPPPSSGAAPAATGGTTADPTDTGLAINTVAPTSAAALPAKTTDYSTPLVIGFGILLMLGGLVVLVRVLRTFRHG